MRINVGEEVKKHTDLGKMVLSSLSCALKEELENSTDLGSQVCTEIAGNEGWAEVSFMVNGNEIDLEKLIGEWQELIGSLIKEEATALVTSKFQDLSDLASDLSDRIEQEVTKRLEDWEV
jgi:hypothetical protein